LTTPQLTHRVHHPDVNHTALLLDSTDVESAFVRLDLRLRLLVDAFRDDLTERARDPLRGLYIAESDVEQSLAQGGPQGAERLLGQPDAPTSARMSRLGELFDLDPLERDIVLVCLAPDVDLRYERLYGYLQDDVTRRRPTIELVLRLLGGTDLDQRAAVRAALAPAGRLRRSGLLAAPDEQADQLPLLARPLRVEERIVQYLLGSDALDPRVELVADLELPEAGESAAQVPSIQMLVGLARLLSGSFGQRSAGPVLYLQASPGGAAKRAIARAACSAAGRALLLVEVPLLLMSPNERTIAAIAREAVLQDAILCFDQFDLLLGDQPDLAASRLTVHQLLTTSRGPTLLLGDKRWEPALWLSGVPAARIELPQLDAAARGQFWRKHVNANLSAADADELAARYRLVEDEAIRAVAAGAVSRSLLRGDEKVASADLRAAARAVAAPPLDGMAYQVEPKYGWDDIVLPADGRDQLRELCDRARYQQQVLDEWGYGQKHARRSGLTALFAGPPGTGKTMAAEIVAGALALELYRIDLSAVVSKYIGETEKNLERIFHAADQGQAVLLFDEADALFGKRSEVRDAHDRYANVETAYLLQRLETYDGVAVLTTNLRGNIDEAFLRRLDCVLEFPMPEEPERLAIWRRALPAQAPLSADLDLEFLARKFKLSGGHIRNIALGAGYLAAAEHGVIGMSHLVRATKREYQKLGKLVAESDFEDYFRFVRDGGQRS
jgi:SpoVK/Ycf46/Vps4 family AAA+-type ATPase